MPQAKDGWRFRSRCGSLLGVNLFAANPTNVNFTEACRCDACPLSLVQSGVAVRIKQLCAAPEVQHRLREIGLGEDQIVKLLTSRGNLICQVCNTRLAISEQLAQLILVEPLRQPVRI